MPNQRSPAGKVTSTLKGPVWIVFTELVPEFRGVDGERFYDLVMSNSELLYACFALFRRFRSKFKKILSDKKGRTINDDFVPLPCGRTVHEIVAMIVRSHAKMHFRRVLPGDPGNPATPAGSLYRAIREYLLHDWQSRLVPAYAGLSVSTVNRLGPALLDARDLNSLNVLVAGGSLSAPKSPAMPEALEQRAAILSMAATINVGAPTAVAPVAAGAQQAPAPAPAPAPTPTPTQAPSPLAEAFWRAANDPAVVAVIGAKSGDQIRDMVGVIGNVGTAVEQDLGAALQLDPAQLFVCLAKALDILGRPSFKRVFGDPGDPFVIDALSRRMAANGIGANSTLQSVYSGLAAVLRTDPRTGLVILPG